MAKPLTNLREFEQLEGLVERLELLEADAAAFDVPAQGALERSRRADTLKGELTGALGRIPERVGR